MYVFSSCLANWAVGLALSPQPPAGDCANFVRLSACLIIRTKSSHSFAPSLPFGIFIYILARVMPSLLTCLKATPFNPLRAAATPVQKARTWWNMLSTSKFVAGPVRGVKSYWKLCVYIFNFILAAFIWEQILMNNIIWIISYAPTWNQMHDFRKANLGNLYRCKCGDFKAMQLMRAHWFDLLTIGIHLLDRNLNTKSVSSHPG